MSEASEEWFDAKYILDKDENVVEVTYGEWCEWIVENRRVARTEINPDVYVSTVFLSMDHGYDEEGPPILFETLVFGGPMNEEIWRYSTKKEALEGHKRTVRQVRKEIAKEESKWSTETTASATTITPRYYG
jgi:hypothetical protein